MCRGREERRIGDNLVKASVRLLVLYNRTEFCPFQSCLFPQDRRVEAGCQAAVRCECSARCGEQRGSLG